MRASVCLFENVSAHNVFSTAQESLFIRKSLAVLVRFISLNSNLLLQDACSSFSELVGDENFQANISDSNKSLPLTYFKIDRFTWKDSGGRSREVTVFVGLRLFVNDEL